MGVWMKPKPSFMSGAWGLGCTWCAAAKHSGLVQDWRRKHMEENLAAGRCKQAISRASVWSRYEIRSLREGKSFKNAVALHRGTDLHRLSQKVFFSPGGHLASPQDPRGQAAHRTAQDSQPLSEKSDVCDVQPVANPDTQGPQNVYESDVQPVATLSTAALSTVGSASDMFRGKVPQCQDWLDCWADNICSVSTQGQFPAW